VRVDQRHEAIPELCIVGQRPRDRCDEADQDGGHLGFDLSLGAEDRQLELG